MVILLTLLAFILMQLREISTRQKESRNSPQKWSWSFFWKDNKYKLPVSLGISLLSSIIFYLTVVVDGEPWYSMNITDSISISLNVKYFIYILFGLVPERIFQFLKDRFKFLQPERVEVIDEDGYLKTFQRK